MVSHYDFNNTYQYVINREETHLSWLQNALAEFGAPLPRPSTALPVPRCAEGGQEGRARRVQRASSRTTRGSSARSSSAGGRACRRMTHARHRTMLDVMLGESLEHKRLFEQAAAGFEDVLGRRTGGVARQGAVLPTRWME